LPKLPPLSNDLNEACSNFRNHPNDRAAWARYLWKSDMGSTVQFIVESVRSDGNFKTTEPKIKLNRPQMLRLLDKPTFKDGYVYFWDCGVDEDGTSLISLPHLKIYKNEKYRGWLSVSFDQDGKVLSLLYYTS
jgi:hypothetical protein